MTKFKGMARREFLKQSAGFMGAALLGEGCTHLPKPKIRPTNEELRAILSKARTLSDAGDAPYYLILGSKEGVSKGNAWKAERVLKMVKDSEKRKLSSEELRTLCDYPLNSLRTITKIAAKIGGDLSIADRLKLETRSDLRILYPGAGHHIAPLELGLALQIKFPNIKIVRFVYTDLSIDSVTDFHCYVRNLRPASRIIGMHEKKCGDGKESVFKLEFFGKRMEVKYAISTTSKSNGDHDYFRRQDAENSDIILFHDTFTGNAGPKQTNAIFWSVVWAAAKGKRQCVVFDYPNINTRSYLRSTLRGGFSKIKGQYAHRYAAMIYLPDMPLIQRMIVSGKINKMFEGLWHPEYNCPDCSLPTSVVEI